MSVYDCKSDEESLRYLIQTTSYMSLVLVGTCLSLMVYFTMLNNLLFELKTELNNMYAGDWVFSISIVSVSLGLLSSLIIEKIMAVVCEKSLNNPDNSMKMNSMFKLYNTLGSIRVHYCVLGLLAFLASLSITSPAQSVDALLQWWLLVFFTIIGISLFINSIIFLIRLDSKGGR